MTTTRSDYAWTSSSGCLQSPKHPVSSPALLAQYAPPMATGMRRNVWSPSIGSTLIVLIAALFLSPSLFAGDLLRCGNRLIETDDTMDKVRKLCGEPNDVSRSRLWRRRNVDPIGYRLHDAQHRERVSAGEWVETIEVQVETWTYNFGPNYFMRRVRFADGILEGIETLGYGHND